MWRDLLLERVCWYCHCWMTFSIRYFLQWARLVSSKQTWARRWAKEHAHSPLRITRARYMMQVSMLIAQLALESELIDWCREATSSPYGQLLVDLSPRRDDWLRYCTSTESIHSKILILDLFKQSKFLDDGTTESLYSPSVPNFFPQMQNSFPSVSPKKLIKLFSDYIVNLLKGNSQSINGCPETKFQNKIQLLTLKRITSKQKKGSSGSRKKVKTHKSQYTCCQ